MDLQHFYIILRSKQPNAVNVQYINALFGLFSPALSAFLSLQLRDSEEGATEDDDAGNPYRVCAGAVSARTAGRVHRAPRLPVETAGAFRHTRAAENEPFL